MNYTNFTINALVSNQEENSNNRSHLSSSARLDKTGQFDDLNSISARNHMRANVSSPPGPNLNQPQHPSPMPHPLLFPYGSQARAAFPQPLPALPTSIASHLVAPLINRANWAAAAAAAAAAHNFMSNQNPLGSSIVDQAAKLSPISLTTPRGGVLEPFMTPLDHRNNHQISPLACGSAFNMNNETSQESQVHTPASELGFVARRPGKMKQQQQQQSEEMDLSIHAESHSRRTLDGELKTMNGDESSESHGLSVASVSCSNGSSSSGPITVGETVKSDRVKDDEGDPEDEQDDDDDEEDEGRRRIRKTKIPRAVS